jgi:hypothetical protein
VIRLDADLFLEFQETRPGAVFRQAFAFLNGRMEHNWAGDRVFDVYGLGSFFQFLNYWSANLNLSVSSDGTLDDRLTRGGRRHSDPGRSAPSRGSGATDAGPSWDRSRVT